MISLKSLRNSCLISLVIYPLIACSQDGQSGDELLQLQAHLEVAELYREQGQFRASVIELQNAFQLVPQNEAAIRQLAALYIQIGDIPQAIELLNTANQQTPNNPATLLLLSEAHIMSGNMSEASALLNALEIPVTDVEARSQYNFLMASVSAAEGDITEAESLLQTILDAATDSTNALILLSKLEYQAGNIDAASTYRDQAISADANNLDLWIWRGQFAMLQADYSTAEDAFYEALDIMSLYDLMTAKKFSILQSVIVPLQMQQKNSEALRFSELIASTPQGEFNSSFSNAVDIFQSGDMAEAEQALNSLLSSSPDHPGSNILLGVAKYAQGKFSEAETLLSDFVDVESASPQLIKTLVATHLRLNEPDKAISILKEAIVNYPEDSSLFSMMGLSYQALGSPEESISSFNQALEIGPDSASIHIALSSTYTQMQDIPKAIEQLNRAIILDPELSEAKSTLLNIYVEQEQLDDAKTLVEAWLERSPDSALNNNLAGVIATRYEDYAQARIYFSRELELDENSIQARLNLARIDIIEENYTAAEEGYTRILEQNVNNASALVGLLTTGELNNSTDTSIAMVQKIIADNPQTYVPPLVLSQYYLQSNNVDSALDYAEEALASSNNIYTQSAVIEVSMRKMRNEAQSGNFQQAQTHIERIQEIQPNSASSYEIEGDLLLVQNEIDSSLDAYQRAWEISAGSALGVKIYRLYSRESQNENALSFLDGWIGQQPDNPSANLLMAMSFQARNQENEAIEHYEVVYQQQPNDLIMLNNLAWLYQDTQPEKALELASQAANLYPENADVLDTYGWILVQQGNSSEGIATLERALELAPDSVPITEHLNAARNGE